MAFSQIFQIEDVIPAKIEPCKTFRFEVRKWENGADAVSADIEVD